MQIFEHFFWFFIKHKNCQFSIDFLKCGFSPYIHKDLTFLKKWPMNDSKFLDRNWIILIQQPCVIHMVIVKRDFRVFMSHQLRRCLLRQSRIHATHSKWMSFWMQRQSFSLRNHSIFFHFCNKFLEVMSKQSVCEFFSLFFLSKTNEQFFNIDQFVFFIQ